MTALDHCTSKEQQSRTIQARLLTTLTLKLGTNQRITQRTRYFNVKWDFFWTQVRGSRTASADAWIEIEQCPTKLMRADMLTKPLPRKTFERHRNAIQGW
jgi:hypothetical protein